MTALPITSQFVAVFAIALIALSVPITLRRLKVGEMIGDAVDETLRQRIRAQGNFIEYVPLGLIGMALVEAQTAPAWLMLSIGGALSGGRFLHAVGMYRASGPLRGFGIMLTYLALVVVAVRLGADALLRLTG
jgi:uncharacterized membrane protein YecN with MAPEG domain